MQKSTEKKPGEDLQNASANILLMLKKNYDASNQLRAISSS